MTYARRFIDVTFSGGQAGTVTFNARGKYALRTSARILKAGGYNFGSLSLEIRGLSLNHIKQLSTYGTRIHPNYGFSVKVDAGDDINGMSTVFQGQIDQAWADMRAMPDCPFHVLANAGGSASTMTAQPTSVAGSTDVVTILQQMAQKAGLGFHNFGVSGQKLADAYHWGSPWKQIKEVLDAANINGFIDNGTLMIWPLQGQTDGNLVISPQTGMRDYPSFTEYGVQVRYEFHRAIQYGSTMTIQSDITPAEGQWRIIRIDYDLQANTPHGQWFAILDGARVGSPVFGL
jgi:hypothetical protein